eukprot:3836297-Prymnesium_polylepis.1
MTVQTDTHRGFARSPGAAPTTGEAGAKVQQAWLDNRDGTTGLRATLQGWDRRNNTTIWKNGNFRLDVQTNDGRECRLAFQEANGVQGQ